MDSWDGLDFSVSDKRTKENLHDTKVQSVNLDTM